MTETTQSPAAPARKPAKAPHTHKDPSVIIRPWPKVVFMYPMFLCATVFWMMAWLSTSADQVLPVKFPWMGNVFMLVTFLNLLVFAFDFSRIKTITIVFGLIAVVFGLFWANENWEVFTWLERQMDKISAQMNTTFYGVFSVMLGGILLLVLVNTRFNYYELNHREILHHHGYLGDVTRMPTTGLRLSKEIYDLMEFALLRSGRLIFYPSTSREAIVIDNVLNVNHAEDRIKDLLSVVAVRMEAIAEHD